MLTRRRCTMAAAGFLLGLLGIAVFLPTPAAGKPPDPPPNFGGSICYSYQSQIWAMNGDGSGKQAVTPASVGGVPSSADHGGHTWWLCSQVVPGGGFYPGTTAPERELYVFRTNSQNVVQSAKLTDLLTAGTNGLGIVPEDSVSWSNDATDSFVSFVGLDVGSWTAHVYRAHISFPVDGTDPFLSEAPQPIFDVPHWSTRFHWSPDGLSIVYAGSGLWVYHLGDPAPTMISADGDKPQWSPPGGPNRIAFENGYSVYTVAPDGSGRTAAYRHEPWPSQDQGRTPFWSPDGKYLAFANVVLKMGKGGVGYYTHQVAVVPWGGGSATVLATGADPTGWRASTPLP